MSSMSQDGDLGRSPNDRKSPAAADGTPPSPPPCATSAGRQASSKDDLVRSNAINRQPLRININNLNLITFIKRAPSNHHPTRIAELNAHLLALGNRLIQYELPSDQLFSRRFNRIRRLLPMRSQGFKVK